jgi:hypothetical protein
MREGGFNRCPSESSKFAPKNTPIHPKIVHNIKERLREVVLWVIGHTLDSKLFHVG